MRDSTSHPRPQPFTLAQALDAGITPDRLRSEGYCHVRRNCYAPSDAPHDDVFDAQGWMAVLPENAAMYGPTAVWWYDLPAPSSADFHIIVPAGGTVPRARAGLSTHEGLRDGDVQVVDGVRVTTPERTWLDLSLTLSKYDLVALGDAMVHKGLTTPEAIVRAANSARGWRHIVRTRTLARLVRAGVDSPPETKVRLILMDGGLPCPAVNPTVLDDDGGWIGQPDLAYVELKIAIQYEGDVHRSTKQRWRADIARDEAFIDAGWLVIRLTARDLARPHRLCDRVRAAITRRRD